MTKLKRAYWKDPLLFLKSRNCEGEVVKTWEGPVSAWVLSIPVTAVGALKGHGSLWVRATAGSPWGAFRAGPGSMGLSHCPARSRAAGRHWGSPSPRCRAPPWGWEVGPWVGPSQWHPQPGRAVGNWRPALLWRCRGRGWWSQGLTRGPGPWAWWGEPQGGWAGAGRAGGALRAWDCVRCSPRAHFPRWLQSEKKTFCGLPAQSMVETPVSGEDWGIHIKGTSMLQVKPAV